MWYIHYPMDTALFSALAEPHRLTIVELLRDGPRPVGDIVSRLGLNQPQVSKHLRILADAGVVKAKPVAQKRIYEISPQSFEKLDEWIRTFRKLWSGRLDRLDELLKAEKKSGDK